MGREFVGDIVVHGETGAHILVAPHLVEFFTQSLTKVKIRGRGWEGVG